ncbi:hypothetical protein ACEQ8H_007885 [Pleosporales sp. CAS-2024a]
MAGNLHGGAVALIFDLTTSTTITAVSSEGFWDTGHVSRNRQVVHLGKRIGLLSGTMRLGSPDGKLCYTCEHQKAQVGNSSL